ncbi:MAG TPA: hypothetical protein VFA55_07975 [Candidatus Kapabacteria bacterium]|nr:hypothetical protein [Candidatus Kapabacteria bacterium]
MRKRSALLLVSVFAALFASWLISCQDVPPVAYIQQIVVQGYLFANRPIDSIIVDRSLPVNLFYDRDSAGITDAQVTITVDSKTYSLVPYTKEPGSYYLPDTTMLVRSGKTYYLQIQYNGQTVTAQTTVPDSIKITKRLPDTLQYPQDTINIINYPDSIITWTGVPNKISYAASITCIDTTYYDSLQHIANRHVYRPGGDSYDNPTSWFSFLPVSTVPVPWTVFKWYGSQRIVIYNIDQNFNDWLKMADLNGGTFTQDLNHINGGIGVFGSAGIDTMTTFLKMP